MAAHAPQGWQKWFQAQWWPVLAVTGATVASMGFYFKRHFANDPEVGRGAPDRGPPAPEDAQKGFGRKSAEATGLMEGDRAFQGIFPAKKMVDKLGIEKPDYSKEK